MVEESGEGGATIGERVGSITALIWAEIPTTKNIYIIHLGLRRPPIDLFAHNNQPKTGGVVEESRERRRNHQGACGVRCSIDLGGDLNNNKKYIYKHLGLRWSLIDYFRCNNQLKTGGHGGGE